MFAIIEYLYKHPPVFFLVAVLLLGLLVAWIAAPVTWRDGEGDARNDSEKMRAWFHWLNW